jgi:hypothetical protein
MQVYWTVVGYVDTSVVAGDLEAESALDVANALHAGPQDLVETELVVRCCSSGAKGRDNYTLFTPC